MLAEGQETVFTSILHFLKELMVEASLDMISHIIYIPSSKATPSITHNLFHHIKTDYIKKKPHKQTKTQERGKFILHLSKSGNKSIQAKSANLPIV